MKENLLLEITCNHCHQLFYLCQSCYRGQRYCSNPCQITAQRQAHRQSQRKYRNTAKGREVHRTAELRRRMGRNEKKEKIVADEGTTRSCRHTKLRSCLSKQKPRCHFCGAHGIVVPYFPRRDYGSRPSIVKTTQRKLDRPDNDGPDYDGTG